MKTIHTVLTEDSGHLTQNLVRSELLSQRGVAAVSVEPTRNRLSVEYDPTVVDGCDAPADHAPLRRMRRTGGLQNDGAAAWRRLRARSTPDDDHDQRMVRNPKGRKTRCRFARSGATTWTATPTFLDSLSPPSRALLVPRRRLHA